PLAYDLVGAKAGDAFCQDAASRAFIGHWDLEGRSPYLRWAIAGGVDYHGENVSSVSWTGRTVKASEIEEMLLAAHARMMAETPPDDGHRRAILDPAWTHVGFGVGWAGGEFRMTEEFSRRVSEWVDLPAGPVRSGGSAPFGMKLPQGWNPGVIDVCFESAPSPLSRAEIARRGSYAYPKATTELRPLLVGPYRYGDGSAGQFETTGGRISVAIPLSRGPGHYWVLVYAGEGSIHGRSLSPAVAGLIVAE
ncbi:MAG TPA: hypothetical protein VLH41_08035, partial [Thermoanaerobaculia bacterium]|nr:hypothetical protein [Thermoanaerobaculia bacterium]